MGRRRRRKGRAAVERGKELVGVAVVGYFLEKWQRLRGPHARMCADDVWVSRMLRRLLQWVRQVTAWAISAGAFSCDFGGECWARACADGGDEVSPGHREYWQPVASAAVKASPPSDKHRHRR